MDTQGLVDRFLAQGGKPLVVFRGEGDPEDRYCIVRENAAWQVFYSERGAKYSFKDFSSEDKACEYLWSLLERDTTVWNFAL